jgi:hypothetical protein
MRFIRRFLLMNHQVWCNQIVNSSSKKGPQPFHGMRFFSPADIRSEPLLFVRAHQHGLPNAADRQRRQVCHKQAKAR